MMANAKGEHDVGCTSDPTMTLELTKAPDKDDLRTRISRSVRAPRQFTLTGRFLLTAGTTAIAFAPVISANFFAVVDGAPTLYLVLLPMWVVMIGYGVGQVTQGRVVIDDKELDWIAAVVICVVAIGCTYMAIPRLLASATLWHIELVPVFAVVFCGCILNFGIRRAFRGWRVLVFTAFCFPGTVVLTAAYFGGTPIVFSLVVAGLNTLAVWFALAQRPLRWRLSFAVAVCTVLGAAALTPLSSTAGLVVPSIVTSCCAAAYAFFRPGVHSSGAYLDMPQRSLISVFVLALVALLALAVLPAPASRVRESSMVTAPTDWLDGLADSSSFNVSEQERFDWGPAILGPGGSVVRYELDVTGDPERVMFLDVFTARSAGVLSSFRGSIWYASNPPARVSNGYAELDHGVVVTGSQNGSDEVASPDESLWAALGWTWKTQSVEDGTVFQRVYLMMSKRADEPRNVPRPTMPTFAGTVLGPIDWLARQQGSAEWDSSQEKYMDTLVETLESILASGSFDD